MLSFMAPPDYRIGDTASVKINGEPTAITWLDAHTVVLGDTDRRRVLQSHLDHDHLGRAARSFLCGASADEADAPDTVALHYFGANGQPVTRVLRNKPGPR